MNNRKNNNDNVKKLLITLVLLLIMNIFCIQTALDFVGTTIKFNKESTETEGTETESTETESTETESTEGSIKKTDSNNKDTNKNKKASKVYKNLSIDKNDYNIEYSDDDTVFLCTTISDKKYVNILSKINRSDNYIVTQIDRQGSCAYITFEFTSDKNKDEHEKGSETSNEYDNTENFNDTKESSRDNKDIKQ